MHFGNALWNKIHNKVCYRYKRLMTQSWAPSDPCLDTRYNRGAFYRSIPCIKPSNLIPLRKVGGDTEVMLKSQTQCQFTSYRNWSGIANEKMKKRRVIFRIWETFRKSNLVITEKLTGARQVLAHVSGNKRSMRKSLINSSNCGDKAGWRQADKRKALSNTKICYT